MRTKDLNALRKLVKGPYEAFLAMQFKKAKLCKHDARAIRVWIKIKNSEVIGFCTSVFSVFHHSSFNTFLLLQQRGLQLSYLVGSLNTKDTKSRQTKSRFRQGKEKNMASKVDMKAKTAVLDSINTFATAVEEWSEKKLVVIDCHEGFNFDFC